MPGLGLSLSYDIIKEHGDEIKVETKEGEGSEFVIQLLTTSYKDENLYKNIIAADNFNFS